MIVPILIQPHNSYCSTIIAIIETPGCECMHEHKQQQDHYVEDQRVVS